MLEGAELRSQLVCGPEPSLRHARSLRWPDAEIKEQLQHAAQAEEAHTSCDSGLPSDHSK